MSRRLPVTAAASLCLPAGDEPAALDAMVSEATGGQRFRRINRFIQLALIGAHRCRNADTAQWPAHQPIVIGSGQGNIADTAALLETVIGSGYPPMPFQFINLAGNMAGFYVAQSLGAESPNVTVSQLDFPWEAALEIAGDEFRRHRCALLGAVDEASWPLAHHRSRLGCGPETQVGEGSHWLRLGEDATALGYVDGPVYLDDEALEHHLAEAGADIVALSPGYGAVPPPLSGPTQRSVEHYPMHEVIAGAVVCGFLGKAAPGERLLQLSANGRGRYAATRVTRAAADDPVCLS